MKPRIVVSKCLEFDQCRYNGQKIPDRFVDQLKSHVEFVPICPEVEIGLGVPRDPIHIRRIDEKIELYQPKTEKIFTKEMSDFSTDFLGQLKDVDGFILKSKSPSCGFRGIPIYSGKGKTSEKQAGLFAEQVLNDYPNVALEDEGRLNNAMIREHFLIKLYTLALFRSLKRGMKELVEFHTINKYLFMSFNQSKMTAMGRVVANHEKDDIETVFKNYEGLMHLLLAKSMRHNSVVNMLMHVLGYFSKQLNSREKSHFLDLLDDYRNHKITLNVCLELLRSWIHRFGQDYLEKQRFFEPFPSELMEGAQVAKRLH